jgi:pimeloyl-ACP methyl ester carboxylesterase
MPTGEILKLTLTEYLKEALQDVQYDSDDYPEIDEWYLGGHSLGGSMAASFLAENTDDFEGLILLGSYSTADITLPVLSIYGSKDNVLNREKYEKYKPNISESLTEFVIDGGCHAYFGMYGEQDGDGTPTISVLASQL